MCRIKNTSLLLSLLFLFSCIKPYVPVIDANAERKYVVSGRVTDVEGWQEVEVSMSSPIESPEYIPVSDCQITILDNKSNMFSLEEYKPGSYHVWMEQAFLAPGNAYQVNISTPEGDNLVSDFDTMPTGPSFDTVYYRIEDIPTSDPEKSLRVMQFYVDLRANDNNSDYYKWDVEETWKYEAVYPAQYYYDGTIHEIIPPDYSNKVCWSTLLAKNVFTVSVKNLVENTYLQYPLHTIDGNSSRLSVLYSILVRQLALSEGAYYYWEKLRINSNDMGGLYEKQPLPIRGNMKNISHPEKVVLGYFYAASESNRRCYYHDIEGIELTFDDGCRVESLGRGGWKNVFPWMYPVYFTYVSGSVGTLTPQCYDCRQLQGTTVKPDFWP